MNANRACMHPPHCLQCLRSAAFILAVLCSFAPICILLPWGGGLALYAKMVNLHSYALASAKMENSKRACHPVCFVLLSPHWVCGMHKGVRFHWLCLRHLHSGMWSEDLLSPRSETRISTSCPRCAQVIFLVIGSFYLPPEAGLFK